MIAELKHVAYQDLMKERERCASLLQTIKAQSLYCKCPFCQARIQTWEHVIDLLNVDISICENYLLP